MSEFTYERLRENLERQKMKNTQSIVCNGFRYIPMSLSCWQT